MKAFGGDCLLTPARVVIEEVDGESVVRLRPGIEAHGRLATNINFQDNLLQFLLSMD